MELPPRNSSEKEQKQHSGDDDHLAQDRHTVPFRTQFLQQNEAVRNQGWNPRILKRRLTRNRQSKKPASPCGVFEECDRGIWQARSAQMGRHTIVCFHIRPFQSAGSGRSVDVGCRSPAGRAWHLFPMIRLRLTTDSEERILDNLFPATGNHGPAKRK